MAFEKGNTFSQGRPKGSKNRETKLFIEAKETVEKARAQSLYEHAIEQAFRDNAVLVQIIKKFVPDKIETDFGDNTVDIEERKLRVKEYLLELMKSQAKSDK